jgi:hypothetical protein
VNVESIHVADRGTQENVIFIFLEELKSKNKSIK